MDAEYIPQIEECHLHIGVRSRSLVAGSLVGAEIFLGNERKGQCSTVGLVTAHPSNMLLFGVHLHDNGQDWERGRVFRLSEKNEERHIGNLNPRPERLRYPELGTVSLPSNQSSRAAVDNGMTSIPFPHQVYDSVSNEYHHLTGIIDINVTGDMDEIVSLPLRVTIHEEKRHHNFHQGRSSEEATCDTSLSYMGTATTGTEGSG